MTLNIQNDLGNVVNSNSYASVSEFRDYWLSRGIDYTSKTDQEIEASLIKAWQYTDTRFDYCGSRLNGRDQTTEFPRQYLYDCEGNLIDGIPYEIKNAQMEYAQRELEGVTLQADSSATGNIKRVRNKIDVIEEEIEYSPSLSGGELKHYPTADNKIPSYFICKTDDSWGYA